MRSVKLWIIGSVAIVAAAFGSLALASPAAAISCSPGNYSVSVNTNVRAGASTSARIVSTARPGVTVQVVGERAGTLVGSSSLWCEVNVNGTSGFIHSAALTPGGSSGMSGNTSADSPAVSITSSTIFHVAGGNRINARSAPSTTASIVSQLAPNTDVIVTGQAQGTRVGTSTVWYAVNYNGRSMYVHSSLLASGSAATPSQPAAQPNNPPAVNTNTNPPPVQPPAASNSFVCPRNCAGAVAMGLSAQQAATCPGLDRDRDGVACYGD